MTNGQENEEARLRERYHEAGGPDPAPAREQDDGAIQAIIRRANAGTGARDLIVLAVSSFLALLQAFTGPRSRPSNDEASKLPPDGGKVEDD
ncbi:MAG: hypothetical protein OEN02_14005 [Gammaproteobacteria bacterium]|nr:hypothetical protein [Gammaproteobacteria bacterium]